MHQSQFWCMKNYHPKTIFKTIIIMQLLRYIITISLFILITTIELHSQSIYVQKANIFTSHLLNDIRSLSYSEGKLIFNETDGSSIEYIIDELKFMKFIYSTTSGLVGVDNRSKSTLYPTLAKNTINIEQSSFKREFILVELISISGSIFSSEKVKVKGSNIQIDVSGLCAGSYICKLTDDQKVETIKFIKQ